MVLWLDPTSFTLDDTEDKSILYDLEEDRFEVAIDTAYVDVIGNIEVIVIAVADDLYNLFVEDVPPLVRGGFVFVDDTGVIDNVLTNVLRSGDETIDIELPQ